MLATVKPVSYLILVEHWCSYIIYEVVHVPVLPFYGLWSFLLSFSIFFIEASIIYARCDLDLQDVQIDKVYLQFLCIWFWWPDWQKEDWGKLMTKVHIHMPLWDKLACIEGRVNILCLHLCFEILHTQSSVNNFGYSLLYGLTRYQTIQIRNYNDGQLCKITLYLNMIYFLYPQLAQVFSKQKKISNKV